ncbi:MAG: hypothetical protein DRJ64_07465 [Thermoprotei archaeon]|nr:MAG: hypothetical protein DRJ64_07465 [Thermoprotei archaeon]
MKKRFDKNIYSLISLTKLTIFAISEIADNNEECVYERVVKECFTLFPRRFGFQRYPRWPDGARVKIEIVRCRDNGWIVGNERNGFQITPLGRKVAQEVLEELQGNIGKKPKIEQTRNRDDAIIRYLRRSAPFKRFRQDERNFTLSEGEFRRLLVSTFETPPRVLKQNLNYCLNICKQCGDSTLFKFLKECERQKAFLLKSHIKGKKNVDQKGGENGEKG